MASIRAEVSLQMGMAGCKVNVETAIAEDKDMSFNNVCVGVDSEHAVTAVKQDLKCPECGNTDKTTFRKGKVNKTEAKVFTKEEIDELTKVGSDVTETIEVTVHQREAVESQHLIPSGAPYWLVPSNNSEAERYAAFVAGLQANPNLVLLAEWAPRTKTGLYEVMVRDGALAFQKLAWPEQVKPAPHIEATPSDKAVMQMGMLLDMGVSDFDVENYRDERKAKVQAMLAGLDSVEVSGGGVSVAPGKASLEDQLAQAVEAMAKAKGITAEGKATGSSTEGKVKAPKKRTPAKASS